MRVCSCLDGGVRLPLLRLPVHVERRQLHGGALRERLPPAAPRHVLHEAARQRDRRLPRLLRPRRLRLHRLLVRHAPSRPRRRVRAEARPPSHRDGDDRRRHVRRLRRPVSLHRRPQCATHPQVPPVQGQSVQGQSVQGQSVQGQSVQGQSVQGRSVQGQSVQGQSVQGQSVQGQSVQCQSIQRHCEHCVSHAHDSLWGKDNMTDVNELCSMLHIIVIVFRTT